MDATTSRWKSPLFFFTTCGFVLRRERERKDQPPQIWDGKKLCQADLIWEKKRVYMSKDE